MFAKKNAPAKRCRRDRYDNIAKLPTPALPGSGSRRHEAAVCFNLSRGCPSAPLFLCPYSSIHPFGGLSSGCASFIIKVYKKTGARYAKTFTVGKTAQDRVGGTGGRAGGAGSVLCPAGQPGADGCVAAGGVYAGEARGVLFGGPAAVQRLRTGRDRADFSGARFAGARPAARKIRRGGLGAASGGAAGLGLCGGVRPVGYPILRHVLCAKGGHGRPARQRGAAGCRDAVFCGPRGGNRRHGTPRRSRGLRRTQSGQYAGVQRLV